MSEEEFLKRNNYLMSHGHLPYDTTTCETWGLSGNCGKNCPNFKNKTCDVYVDVLERINQELQQQNQKYKEVIDKAIEWIKKKINSCTIEAESTTKDTMCKITISGLYNLLNILEEVE